ncbi:tripartite tricarboxylate transporter substrate binding protein [Acidovorax sp. Leaf160]|uniref:Bug family tripartite tricarboxylate transporter substrate binding protein n=1 Tax=Acidovorax sp. Leaf160 TaxID=1736280 RepID=UPI0006F8F747|nr:tripartite tricarboxylate transporter substrate-binding protein [Acidovorax sp. Leaf160]KQR43098.1 ABC transporter substrate-binding protein [Acidovorax sp. Leaf160]
MRPNLAPFSSSRVAFAARRHALVAGAAAALLLAAAAPAALAQQPAAGAYPVKPITIVVGYPAGGSTDLMGRLVGTELANRLGQPVVIENIGGAGGAIGAQKVASAPADGYTLLVGASNEIAINKLVTKKVKYDVKDFTAIGLVGTQPMVLVASPGAGVKNAAEFVQKVSANPGKFSYGSSGVGTALHLTGEMVKEQGKLFMTHIPYRGVAPLTNDLLGNNLEFGVFVLSSGLPHIKSGKVVALGTTEAKRSAITPDIPALAESPQFKNVDINIWFALMAPAKLPAPVYDKLKKALNETLQSPEFRKKMEAAGSVVSSPTVDADKYIAAEVAKYQKIVQFAKIEE